MVIELDKLFYDALQADETLKAAVGGRIVSTCFEVGPDEKDNTPLPCIIVTDDGLAPEYREKMEKTGVKMYYAETGPQS